MTDEIIKALIEAIGSEARAWIDWWLKHKAEKQPMLIIDEMLRNPAFRFRGTATMARAIHDTTDGHKITEKLLSDIGARHNSDPGEKDLWTMDKNWEKGPDGVWKLRAGVTAGTI